MALSQTRDLLKNHHLLIMIYRIIFLLSFLSWSTFAQSDSLIEDLDIRIMTPKLDKNMDYSIQPKLERKVIDIFTQHDITNRKASTFAVYPMLSAIEYGSLEGIANEVTVQLELGLLVKNIFSDQYILIFSHKLSGSGKNKKSAVNRAISGIRPQRKAYRDFIQDVRQKINRYYEQECSSITMEAQAAIQKNDFQKAISLLYVLPNQSACKAANKALLERAYEQYQRQNCQSLIQKADLAVLQKNYKTAIDLLAKIDMKSSCAVEAKALLQKITVKLDEQTSKKMAFLNKVYQDNVELEKAKQESMKSISNTYIEGIKKD